MLPYFSFGNLFLEKGEGSSLYLFLKFNFCVVLCIYVKGNTGIIVPTLSRLAGAYLTSLSPAGEFTFLYAVLEFL